MLGMGRCSGQAAGFKWTDKPSFTAKNVKSGQACCAACLKSAQCQRYQFSAAAGVGCQLFYSKAPKSKPLTKKARSYVLGKSEWSCRAELGDDWWHCVCLCVCARVCMFVCAHEEGTHTGRG